MIWLEAALALVFAMLVFSTIVTVVVDTLHRLIGLPGQGLQAMLEGLFDEVLWPHFGSRIPEAGGEEGKPETAQERARSAFVDAMIRNPAAPRFRRASLSVDRR